MDYPASSRETRFDELKRYVRFTEDDTRRLLAFRETAAPHFSRIAQEFYERIREHDEAHAIFTGEEQIQRLQRSLVEWLGRLLGGLYGEDYFERTQRIGRMHVKVGLPQRYMFTAMAVIRSSLTDIASENLSTPDLDPRDSLSRLLDLELAIMVDSYREDLLARVERVNDLDREALSRRVERTEHRYVNAVELAQVMVIGLDRAGRILLFNKEAERITGYARDEAEGRDFTDLLLPSDLREQHRGSFVGTTSPVDHIELPFTTRAGRVRAVRWQIARVARTETTKESEDLEILVTGSDVTDERTARLRTRQQERLAAVGTLAAGLAHEIRNPLNGAQLHVSFLERTLACPDVGLAAHRKDALDAVHVVGDEIKRLARLVTEFLDFARPRPLVLKPTSVHGLCERAAQLARVAGSPVTITLDLGANDPHLMADPDRLLQVLLNLLSNAVEAVTPQAGTVILRARREPRAVVIDVEDNGPGLPSESAPIFDAFFSTKPQGTGLGLAIAHRVVTDHAGTIDVESKRGRTRFRVTLPLTSGSRE